MSSARQTVTRIEVVARGARGSTGLFAWRHRVDASAPGAEARLRARSAFDPALHEFVRNVNSEWIALDGERDELDVGSVFAAVCDCVILREQDDRDAQRELLEARREPRVWLTALDAEADEAPFMVGGVRIFAGDREVVPVPCCTETWSWAGWRAPITGTGESMWPEPIVGTGQSWQPAGGHEPWLGFRVMPEEIEVELSYDESRYADRELVSLERVSFEAAIASADARVKAFAALAERWIAQRCTPEECARISAWVRTAVGLERAPRRAAAESDSVS